MSGTTVLSALTVIIGIVAFLLPRTLSTINPFGSLRIFQRIANSRPLMMMARLGGAGFIAFGAMWLWEDHNKGPFEKMASSEYILTARRMDAISRCQAQPEWKASWTPGAVNPNRSAIFSIACMARQGYEFSFNSKGCSHATDRKWENWPEADNEACYRSKDLEVRLKEDSEPLPIPYMGLP